MEKIIIENRSKESLQDAILATLDLVKMGRISNNNTQYCYVARCKNKTVIFAYKNKKSDRFVIMDDD